MTQDNAPNPFNFGYARAFPGYWLAPGGLRIVSEADAIAEITELMGNAEDDE
jgi:hypothetical protein